VENFLPYHPGLSGFLQDPALFEILGELMGERAVLFKEKVNFKLPGGKGFKAHQDAPAFVTFEQTYHITLMISVDPATVENGCLELVRGHHRQGTLPQAPDGTLSPELIASLRFEPLPMQPGDVLLFDSYVPHGSQENRSQTPRRAFYVTYNRASERDRRSEYFAHKRAAFPPECERLAGVDYAKSAGIYNLGNPID
jgi:ectoine hydroxylase-related dioxygenase (phytanoyl-CoA dioxygenase family)